MPPSTCEACNLAHTKCRFEPLPAQAIQANDDGKRIKVQTPPRCTRCFRLNLLCVPKVRKKLGRPLSTKSKQFGQTESMQLATDTKRNPKEALHSVSEWSNCHVFYPQANAQSQYQVCAALLKMCKENAIPTQSRMLYWQITFMFRMAKASSSMSLLHAATTLALSCGFNVDSFGGVMFLNQSPQDIKLTAKARAAIDRVFASFDEDAATAKNPDLKVSELTFSSLVRVIDGERSAVTGPNFSRWFQSAAEISKSFKSRPGFYKPYFDLFANDLVRSKYVVTCIKGFLGNPVVQNEDGVDEFWYYKTVSRNEPLRDRNGNILIGDVEAHNTMICIGTPRVYHSTIVKNLRPYNDAPELVRLHDKAQYYFESAHQDGEVRMNPLGTSECADEKVQLQQVKHQPIKQLNEEPANSPFSTQHPLQMQLDQQQPQQPQQPQQQQSINPQQQQLQLPLQLPVQSNPHHQTQQPILQQVSPMLQHSLLNDENFQHSSLGVASPQTTTSAIRSPHQSETCATPDSLSFEQVLASVPEGQAYQWPVEFVPYGEAFTVLPEIAQDMGILLQTQEQDPLLTS